MIDEIIVGKSYILGKTPKTQSIVTVKRIFIDRGDKIIECLNKDDGQLEYYSPCLFRLYATKEVEEKKDD